MNDRWEIIDDDFNESVRRRVVPGGWTYQTQDGRKYRTAPGTCGRDSDLGSPTWGPMIFVPNETK